MKVLLLGEGAALHALAWKLISEPEVEQVYCAPGNAGTTLLLGRAPFSSQHVAEIAPWAFAQQVDLVVVQGRPEWVDTLASVGLPVLGTGQREWRALRFRQEIGQRLRSHAVPWVDERCFREREPAERYLAGRRLPLRIRPNEAAEREVVRVGERLESFRQLAHMLSLYPVEGICIGEEVSGTEVTLALLCDGERAISLGVSRPYDRRYEGETGPITEGMGAYAPYGDPALEEQLLATVGRPAVAALRAEGLLRPAFLTMRIVLGTAGPLVRDLSWGLDGLHAAVTLPRWPGEAAGVLQAAAQGRLATSPLSWLPGVAVAIALVSEAYPDPSSGGQVLPERYDVEAIVLHDATRLRDTAPAGPLPVLLRSLTPYRPAAVTGQVETTGGRALIVVGFAAAAYEACRRANEGAAALAFEHGAWRRDIGAELL